MAGKFAEIAFTDTVKAAQTRYGSREMNAGFEGLPNTVSLGPHEVGFIEARDGFYQATVSEDGWPYVQFRGGPAGFLRVLDDQTIGYADFRGNRQYLSVGNMNGNDRVAMILMDYVNRRRLKLWARATLVHAEEDPGVIEALRLPNYRAKIERAVLLRVEAFDWNCPQHITPRYSEAEIRQIFSEAEPV